MTRVKWKGPYIQAKLLKKVTRISKKNIKTVSRQSVITHKFIGVSLQIHNGKSFGILKITNDMVGHKLGEFFPTRKQFSYKKNKKNKR